jgi:hypothetical protein
VRAAAGSSTPCSSSHPCRLVAEGDLIAGRDPRKLPAGSDQCSFRSRSRRQIRMRIASPERVGSAHRPACVVAGDQTKAVAPARHKRYPRQSLRDDASSESGVRQRTREASFAGSVYSRDGNINKASRLSARPDSINQRAGRCRSNRRPRSFLAKNILMQSIEHVPLRQVSSLKRRVRAGIRALTHASLTSFPGRTTGGAWTIHKYYRTRSNLISCTKCYAT